MVPVISVIGANKKKITDLIESLVKELRKRHIIVGVIKHHVHSGLEIDVPGKPSYRHRQAGAVKVAVSSPHTFAFIRELDDEIPLSEIVSHYFSDVDVVLTEGYSMADTFKIEVVDCGETITCADNKLLLGVGDSGNKGQSRYTYNQADKIAESIIKEFIK